MSKRGVLLINLGTPDDTSVSAVRRYLKEFLHDPRVIDLPRFWRWLLVDFLILPFRSKKSARAYQQIWLNRESPLLKYTRDLSQAVQQDLGDEYQVEFAMRYGHPSIASVSKKMVKCAEIKVIPLFPQYASASTGSAIEETLTQLKARWNIPQITIQRDFFANQDFIHAYAEIITKTLSGKQYDKLVFSYHGLPERHINKSECQASCDHLHPCPIVTDANRFCYRAQCYETTRLIAQELQLPEDRYVVAFQSRLGRTPWIKPYTDLELPKLIAQGVKNIAVVCPSFVADCLETLEEVNIRTRAQWQALGGEDFIFVPCLNSNPSWVTALSKMSAE